MLSIHYCTGLKSCQGRCYNDKMTECKICRQQQRLMEEGRFNLKPIIEVPF